MSWLAGKADIILENGNEYRYSLSRIWDVRKKMVCFVMLNPSTANASKDDPTIRRCVGFAQRWGYGSLEVVNLFALITPDPTVLESTVLPVGTCNDREIELTAQRAETVVVAWGAFKQATCRSKDVLQIIQRYHQPICLGKTKEGHPRHPLYLPKNVKIESFGCGKAKEAGK